MGDLKAHHRHWVRLSKRTSIEGNELEAICSDHGLQQLVTKPKRGPYLLDLVLTDLPAGVRCQVVRGIHTNDHDEDLTFVNVGVTGTKRMQINMQILS